ncbi:hypothetical protein Asulf_00710 [Archaeoglobus sulfaticallidus PM70-1]|uniref:Amidohydrolase-related domain-containing protein n=1 Tax=Archaeoglobus sulfaticallidus PM70-1 TaxID=387631 RepID=N0BEM6_9EURY|nr:amidohydrolase family protein [Archaeoglobus sulfaticallidus]AGK60727.1 hypothetical protein Asulf_00710 [Archaeoglobus sulfaticallidus PM70-1]
MFNDCHIHIVPYELLKKMNEKFAKAIISNMDLSKSPENLIKCLDDSNIECVAIMSYPSPHTNGLGMEAVYSVIDYCREHRDRLYPFGSIYPHMDRKDAIEHLEKQYDLGIAGIKLHPVHQYFYPNDYSLESLTASYEFAVDHELPILFHTGTSILPGARVKYGNPINLDDVALDFPELRIIMSHGGRPIWMREAFFILRRHGNVWFDISGIPPKKLMTEYFPRFELVAEKSIYGSDFPSPGVKGIKENLELFLSLDLDNSMKKKIAYHNFRKLYRGV